MRPNSFTLLASLMIGGLMCGGFDSPKPCLADEGHDHGKGEHNHAAPQQYFVTLAIYEAAGIDSLSTKPAEMLNFIKSNNLKPTQTIRLSTSSVGESTIQFAKRVSVTTGQTFSRGVTAKQKQFMDVGTVIQIATTPAEEGVDVKISLEASSIQPSQEADSPPDVGTRSLETQLRLRFDRPQLLGGVSGGDEAHIVMTVSRLD